MCVTYLRGDAEAPHGAIEKVVGVENSTGYYEPVAMKATSVREEALSSLLTGLKHCGYFTEREDFLFFVPHIS